MTTSTRPTRPVWLAVDIIDDDLVQRIHEHADRVVPIIERLAEWTAAARVLIAEHQLSGGDLLPDFDGGESVVERWDGHARLGAINILLSRLADFYDYDLHDTPCESNYSTAQALAEMRGDYAAADAERDARNALRMAGAGVGR